MSNMFFTQLNRSLGFPGYKLMCNPEDETLVKEKLSNHTYGKILLYILTTHNACPKGQIISADSDNMTDKQMLIKLGVYL